MSSENPEDSKKFYIGLVLSFFGFIIIFIIIAHFGQKEIDLTNYRNVCFENENGNYVFVEESCSKDDGRQSYIGLSYDEAYDLEMQTRELYMLSVLIAILPVFAFLICLVKIVIIKFDLAGAKANSLQEPIKAKRPPRNPDEEMKNTCNRCDKVWFLDADELDDLEERLGTVNKAMMQGHGISMLTALFNPMLSAQMTTAGAAQTGAFKSLADELNEKSRCPECKSKSIEREIVGADATISKKPESVNKKVMKSFVPKAELISIECPGCEAQMKVPKLNKMQEVTCKACGLSGEIMI